MVPKLVKAAFWYIRRDFAVFRLSNNSKVPRYKGSFKDATLDPEQAKSWFRGNFNIGIATGSISNLLVIDVDCKDGKQGFKNLLILVAATGIDLKTFTVKSPSGGKHFYYDTTGLDTSRVTIGAALLPGIDWRCNGGYIVAPPSVIDGSPYKVVKNLPLRACSQELLDYIVAHASLETGTKNKSGTTLASSSQCAVEGTRNNECYKYARQLLKKELSDEENKALILAFAANCVDANKQPAPLDPAEALRCLASAEKSYNNHLLNEDDAVEMLNKKYGVIDSPVLVIRESFDPVTKFKKVNYLTTHDLEIVQKNVLVKCENGTTKMADKVWLSSPNRRQYESIVFAPGQNPDGAYNLFDGFAYPPTRGKCGLFLNHILKVICSSNEKHCEYVLNWLAHLFQQPAVLPEVALILQGTEGIGKGIFANTIAEMVGNHALHLDNVEQMIGRFNAHLGNVLLVFADESLWGGNKQSIGRLNLMITDKTLTIEPKGKEHFTLQNYKRFIFATNEDWAAPVGPQARRFFSLFVSDEKRRDYKYFAAIQDELENGGYEALMYYFLNRDIANFNPRVRPYSRQLFWLKLQSANSVEQFWFGYLREATREHWQQLVPTNQLFGEYSQWCDSTKAKFPESPVHFGRKLRESCCKHLVNKSTRYAGHQYYLGTLPECKKAFEKAFDAREEIWKSVW